MKQPKRLTREQKMWVENNLLDSMEWMFVKESGDSITIVNKNDYSQIMDIQKLKKRKKKSKEIVEMAV